MANVGFIAISLAFAGGPHKSHAVGSDGLEPVIGPFDLLVPNQPFVYPLESRQPGIACVKFADRIMVAPPRPYRVGIYTFLSRWKLSRYWDVGV